MKMRLKKKILPTVLVVGLTAIFVFICIFVFFAVEKNYIYPLYKYETVSENARKNDLPVALIYAVIKTESGFKENKVSVKGAIGLMQIMPQTGEFIAEKMGRSYFDLKEGETNIEFGCYYLRYLYTKFSDIETTVCAYNAGEGRVEKWLKNADYSPDGRKLSTVPFDETREYLVKIKKSFKKYVKLHGYILDKKNIFE